MSAINQVFVSKYIRLMVKQGFDDPDKIIAQAKNEIVEIDKQLSEADKLRVRRLGLYSVLSYYGESSSSSRYSPSIMDDDSEEAKQLRTDLIKCIEEHKELSNSEIFAKLGKQENQSAIVRAIKWLGEKGIVRFDHREEGKRLVAGPDWEKAKELIAE